MNKIPEGADGYLLSMFNPRFQELNKIKVREFDQKGPGLVDYHAHQQLSFSRKAFRIKKLRFVYKHSVVGYKDCISIYKMASHLSIKA